MAWGDLVPWNRGRGLTRAREGDPFSALRRDMDRLFDDFWRGEPFRGFNVPSPAFAGGWPTLDVSETDKDYKITAELPGLEEKDVKLTLRDNVLVLSGEKRSEKEENGENRHVSERFYGSFQRAIPFDAEVDPDKVVASFKNGVLTVTAPKNPAAQDRTKRIEIKAG